MTKPARVAACVFSILAAPQGLRPVYTPRELGDRTNAAEPARLSEQDEATMKGEVFRTARQYWKGRKPDYSPQFEILGVAKGSFTRPGSIQKAVLYRYCVTGHNWSLNGIAVLENGTAVAHVVYEGAWEHAIRALPDIDGDGRSEILIVTG